MSAPAGSWWSRLTGIQKLGLAVLVIAVAAWLAYNTNPGKKLLAQVGLETCIENQLTGHVSCGEDAERLIELREELTSGFEEDGPAPRRRSRLRPLTRPWSRQERRRRKPSARPMWR